VLVTLPLDLVGGGARAQQAVDDRVQRAEVELAHRLADRIAPGGAVSGEALHQPWLGQRGV